MGSPQRVLMLSGWSDGPLGILQYAFPDVQFIKLEIPTPPAGTLWLWNRYVALLACFLCLVAVGFMKLLRGTLKPHSALVVMGLLGCVFFLRLLVYNIVRVSVKDSMRALLQAIGDKEAPDIAAIVGFSWGGGVLWQMMCESATAKALQNIPVLLLAPTIEANAKCSGQRYLPPQEKDPGFSKVHVVCGSNDPFCPPSQEALVAKQSRGKAHFHTVDDDHVLFSSVSRRLYCRLLQQMLSSK